LHIPADKVAPVNTLQPHTKPTVTWEDQQNINKFSNAFQRQGELEALLQAQKKLVDDIDDASAELMLADDDEQVKMQVGEYRQNTAAKQAKERLSQGLKSTQPPTAHATAV
jgi:chaperonin cofactor prefoldin